MGDRQKFEVFIAMPLKIEKNVGKNIVQNTSKSFFSQFLKKINTLRLATFSCFKMLKILCYVFYFYLAWVSTNLS